MGSAKIATAQQKKDAAYQILSDLRNDMKYQVNNLEQKKQQSLLGNMEQYWSSYSSFAAAQSSILSQHSIEKETYSAPSQIAVFQAPSQQIVTPSPPENNGYSVDDQKNSI